MVYDTDKSHTVGNSIAMHVMHFTHITVYIFTENINKITAEISSTKNRQSFLYQPQPRWTEKINFSF